MTRLVWDKTLSVHVGEIDNDHRKLVDLFNLLSEAVEQGERYTYIDAIIDELVSCTVWHFRHEERLMIKYSYPDYPAHRSEHDELIEAAAEFQKRVRSSGKPLSKEDIDYLEKWLTGHILSSDMALGEFLGKAM